MKPQPEMIQYLLDEGCPQSIIDESTPNEIENMFFSTIRENHREARRGFECSMSEQLQGGI